MTHISRGVEYALHSLLYLSEQNKGATPSAQELAEFQNIPRAYVAKLFTRLEKAGLVSSAQGARGGYTLARPPRKISVLDVVDAVDGHKKLFECTEIRRNCVLFGDSPPAKATRGLCNINRVMLEAEQAARAVMQGKTLADIGSSVAATVPVKLIKQSQHWFADKAKQRTQKSHLRRGNND